MYVLLTPYPLHGARLMRVSGIVVYRVIEDTPQILLLKSSSTSKWGPPKGRARSHNESNLQCAKRKTQQECGLSDIKVDEGFEEKITYDYHGQSKSSTNYVGYVEEGCEIVLSNKHSDYIWAERGLALGLAAEKTNCDVFVKLYQKVFDWVEIGVDYELV